MAIQFLNTVGIDEFIIHNGDTTTKFGFVANNNFAINTAGTERVRVTSGGFVGIGTNNPASKLHVNSGYLRVDNSGGSDNYYLEFYEAGAQRFRVYENANNVYFDGGPGNTHFRPRQGGGTNNFVVTGSNVGFGTSSPSRNLVVQGGGSAYLSIASGATSGSHLLMGSSFDDDEAWIQYNNNTNSMSFKVNGLFDVFVLNSDGSIQQGNSSATGQYAAAFGQNNTANSLEAFATGENTTASGRQAFSGGFNTTASGAGSFAHGGSTLASGTNSFAVGAETEATSAGAAAFNNQTNATGVNSFATGGNTTASGEASFSGGVSSLARGLASVSFGLTCGTGTSAQGAFAGGTVSNANGTFSMAYGNVCTANGTSSQALGYLNVTQSSASYAFAAGFNNQTSGSASALFGQQNVITANGTRSFVGGFQNRVEDQESAIFGSFNNLNQTVRNYGASQFLIGRYLNVPRAGTNGSPGASCTVVGKHNLYNNRGRDVFVVGTGAGVGAEANSFSVDDLGNVLMDQVVNKNYSSDTAAAAGGVPIGGIYHNSGDLKIRLT